MSDDTRPDDSHAPEPDPNRTSPTDRVETPWPDDLAVQIEQLITEGQVILGLAVPWAEAVWAAIDRFEQLVVPLHLDDDLHHQLSRQVGVDRLYELLDHLDVAVAEVC